MFVEKSGLGPFDTRANEVETDGAIEVITGVASRRSGRRDRHGANLRRCARRRLRAISVIHGQTDRIDKGMGAFASRVTVMCGEATRLAATKLRGKALHARRRTDAERAPTRSTSSTARLCAPASPARRCRSPNWRECVARRPDRRGHVRVDAHGLPLRRAHRGRARRCRDRRCHHRALRDRLRRRQGGQSETGRRPDRRRPGAGHRRRAAGGVRLRRRTASRCR